MNKQWDLLLVRFNKILSVALLLSLLVGCGDEGSSCAGLVPADPVSKDAIASTYELSGNFTVDGEALAGVTVTLSGTDITTTTDENGDYIFSGLENGSYIIVPSLDGYVFTPISEVVVIDGSSAATDFTSVASAPADPATPADPADPTPTPAATFKLGGYVGNHAVADSLGLPISGVTITLTGKTGTVTTGADGSTILTTSSGVPVTGTTLTGADGFYEFTVASGAYYVTASKADYSFIVCMDEVPTGERTALVNVTDRDNGANFAGSSTIPTGLNVLGGILHPGPYVGMPGSVFGGVTVTLKRAGTDTIIATVTTSDTTGGFKFSNVFSGTYTVTPTMAGYTFTPATQTITVTDTSVDGMTSGFIADH